MVEGVNFPSLPSQVFPAEKARPPDLSSPLLGRKKAPLMYITSIQSTWMSYCMHTSKIELPKMRLHHVEFNHERAKVMAKNV